jgi:hypothetical protein
VSETVVSGVAELSDEDDWPADDWLPEADRDAVADDRSDAVELRADLAAAAQWFRTPQWGQISAFCLIGSPQERQKSSFAPFARSGAIVVALERPT